MANVNNINITKNPQKYKSVFGFLKSIFGNTFGSMFFSEKVDDEIVDKFDKNMEQLEAEEINANKKEKKPKSIRSDKDILFNKEEILDQLKAAGAIKEIPTKKHISKERD